MQIILKSNVPAKLIYEIKADFHSEIDEIENWINDHNLWDKICPSFAYDEDKQDVVIETTHIALIINYTKDPRNIETNLFHPI